MTPSRRRSESALPEFDPYGYSPFDPQFKAYADAASKANNGYEDPQNYAGSDGRGYGHSAPFAGQAEGFDEKPDYGRHRGTKTSSSRRSRKVKAEHPRDKDDEWETDYDPRDKYYLSGDDGHSPTRKHPKDNYKSKSSRSRNADEDHRRHSARHGSSKSTHSSRHPVSRRDSSERTSRHHHSSASPSSRPKPMSRNSSYGGRPRAVTRHSSYGGRPRAITRHSSYGGNRPRSKYPPNASRSRVFHRRNSDDDDDHNDVADRAWQEAGKAALKAGAIAALKVSRDKGSFVEKGTKVASAAIGAAVVDAMLCKKKPGVRGGKRHSAAREMAEMAVGLLVARPAMKGIDSRRSKW